MYKKARRKRKKKKKKDSWIKQEASKRMLVMSYGYMKITYLSQQLQGITESRFFLCLVKVDESFRKEEKKKRKKEKKKKKRKKAREHTLESKKEDAKCQ